MVIDFYLYGLALLTLVLCVLAAWHDVRSLTIHNGTIVGIALVFCVAYGIHMIAINEGWLDAPVFQSIGMHLGSVAIVFLVCFSLFWFGILGGGDAKMATALALWIPLSALPGFIMMMSLVGGVLGLSALALKGRAWLKPTTDEGWIAALKRGESTVPYGIALTAAAVYSFAHLGYIGI